MPQPPARRIGVDLDNVCYPFADIIRSYAHETTGRTWEDLVQPQRWDFYLEWGMSEAEYRRLEHDAVCDGVLFRTGEPIQGAREQLQQLARSGFAIHFITARCGIGPDEIAEAHTRAWLAEHDLPHDSVVFTRDKQQAAEQLRLGWAVDDAVHHYEQFCNAGAVAFLFDQPWNRHHDGRRVLSWNELHQQLTSTTVG